MCLHCRSGRPRWIAGLILLAFVFSHAQSQRADIPLIGPDPQPMERALLPAAPWPHAGQRTYGGTFRVVHALPEGFDMALAVEFQRAIDSIRTVNGQKGVVVGVEIPSEGTWIGASGLSSNAPDTLRPDMLFGIASNTKTFTSALIMQLVEEGLLALDDSVGKWLGPLPNVTGSATIRQLLNMSSGIRDALNDSNLPPVSKQWWCESLWSNPGKFWDPETLILQYGGAAWFSPGTSWRYSNTNYSLLGMIIEKVTGTSVRQQLHDRILTPLNLTSTFLETEDTLSGDIAHPWSYFDCTPGPPVDISPIPRVAMYSGVWTAGAMFSTVSDMLAWNQNLFNGETVVTKGTMEQMQNALRPGPFSNDPYSRYGLGIFSRAEVGRMFWGHTGGVPGYSSLAFYMPATKASIVVLINEQPTPVVWGYLRALFRLYLEKFPSPAASAGIMYAASANQNGGVLHTVSTSTAQVDSIGDCFYPQIRSLSVHPISGALMGLAAADYGNSWALVRIDPTTGETFPVSVLSLPGSTNLKGMVFREDTLYLGGFDGSLYAVHWQNGTAQLLGNSGIPISGLAVHPVTGELWASVRPTIGGSKDLIYRITLPACDTVRVGSTGTGQIAQDIMFDAAGDLFGLVGSGGQTNRLIRIDTSRGNATEIGSLGRTDLLAIAGSGILTTVGREIATIAPERFMLSQNFPNPFNPSTMIRFTLPKRSFVTIKVFDLLGREVAVLVSEELSNGAYSTTWDATGFPSGLYVCQIEADSYRDVKKLILLK